MVARPNGEQSSQRPQFKVGDRVRVRLGVNNSLGTIVEDCGWLASGGRRLFRVQVDFDPPNTTFIELPEEELLAAN